VNPLAVKIKGGGFGLIGDMIVGVRGALLGGFLLGVLGVAVSNLIGPLITAVIGAIGLLFLVRLIKK
jgi:uncharacterized membrane protein YeaQ/YmgE (transglycosylase-associated protein family)